MKKDCEFYMEQYLELDKDQRIPGYISRHIFSCKKCRHEIKALSKAEHLAARPLSISVPLQKDTIRNAVNEVNPELDPKNIKVPIFQWILFGLLLVGALVFYGTISDSMSKYYKFAFFLVYAGALCAYIAAFIGTNLDFFVKKIESSARNLQA